jgi:major membrane immunogen (membrane-anchored lipoprotein)
MKPVALAIVLALGLVACSEKAQVAEFKQGKYQGKPDNQPWANDPLPADFGGGTWTKGDRTSWEESIRKRQLAQHEYRRIYQ